jgi:hypothetical protein
LSLAAVLELRGGRPSIADLNRIYFDYAGSADAGRAGFAEAAGRTIVAHDAEVYGFGSICSGYPLTIRIAEAVKALRPDAVIVFGGPQASVVDLETLAAFPFVDMVLRGEAEQSLPILLEELAGGRRLDRVPGLTYREGANPRRNANAPVIADLDALPLPAYHLTGELHGATRATLELGRGCPFACTFCSTNDFFRRNFRLRSPRRVLHDMRAIAEAYSISEFELVHDMFTVDRRRVAEFCHAMIASGDGFTWTCSARTDCIDEELLDLMRRAGCRGIFYGVETGSARMQKIVDKHLDPVRAAEMVSATDRRGIRTTVSFIGGYPEETCDDLRDTLRLFVHSLRCPRSNPQLNVLAPLAATPLHWKHRHEMVLEDLCSVMSHQGKSQDPADMEFIRRYPEIFPNFYLLPTPHLDRGMLLELREYSVIAPERFRWLVCAIEQAAPDFLDLFLEWRDHRHQLHPELAGGSLRQYYRTGDFVRDYVAFVRAHPMGATPLVKAVLDYQASADADSGQPPPGARPVRLGGRLRPTDIPVAAQGGFVLELPCDIERLREAIETRTEPVWDGLCFYSIVDGGDAGRFYRISDWVAFLLRSCDGRRTIGEVVARVSGQLTDIEEPLRAPACRMLVEGAQAEGFLRIFRTASNAGPSHNGDGARPEYSEISASASRQKACSIQRL